MSDLFEDPAPARNTPEYTVSELSGAVKRVIEGEFGLVRVRGEIGRVSRPASGHLYFDLKDDRAVIAAICWKGQAGRLSVRPEEGMEVVATGRMTTFPGQSKYQIIVEDMAPAGAGALMAMLEKRRAQLAAEGLFDTARKRPLPFLPRVIGVVTSPSGAVIRDILHRLRDRFPSHVLIWPVAVQGEKCAPEVAAAIRGFNALPEEGPIPRPDLLIVARGGGSLEDLWGFNEEIVVRAAAESAIPLISAVGHETDTTLIDHAADRRAPTPTAAAEMAVPVRLDLLATIDGQGARLSRCAAHAIGRRDQRLRDLSRALPRLDSLTAGASQRFDLWAARLGGALGQSIAARRARLDPLGAHLRPRLLADLVARQKDRLADRARSLESCFARRGERRSDRLAAAAARLAPAFARALADAGRAAERDRSLLGSLGQRLDEAPGLRLRRLSDRLQALDRLHVTLGYERTLARGYAVVRGDGQVVTTRTEAERAAALEIQFQDGRLTLSPRKGRRKADTPPAQGSLL
ncbi:exodeoxyribonuclease VII large subunit [Cereibacter sphaeroides]|uniref:exodeoxyribonuclease VII large subunit n=1 Tax=Cereibacter sphaeroides TaxID=1063 RepID=UPI001F3AF486|nr:exodeoxyribonuclease VII large subunit [Cereibacter sphaeroides]MCE6961186.1 exodeoxyribonuclease VII large subunit [Cereibacter sphaeroides]MCE6970172.1 exodeoxyribonuclease VII large subunit [Cereibacter sphaeroides]MCE6974089.1 exodeoxyribonuclease VII large subunit [Cereibacter sphaeroides]